MISLKLPLPISVNEAYAWYPRRHKSDKYKKWEIASIKALKTQQKYTITGDSWLSAIYVFHVPIYCKNGKKKIWDVANREKVLSDFLCHEIPWLADHKFLTMTLVKKDSADQFVEVIIEEI